MSFEKIAESFQKMDMNPISVNKKYPPYKYKSNRNPQCIPSDDDEEEKEKRPVNKKLTKNVNEKKPIENLEEDMATMGKRVSKKPGKGPKREVLRQTKSEGNTGYMASIIKTRSTDDLSRIRTPEADEDDEVLGQYFCYRPETAHSYQSHSRKQPQPVVMSGMDLLIQREQERAKRQKPKNGNNPGKVKIEGLLGKVPGPGTHNISFQHLQLQQQQQQQQQSIKSKKNKMSYPMVDYGRTSPMLYPPTNYYPSPNMPMHPVYLNYPASFYPSPSSSRQSSSSSLPYV